MDKRESFLLILIASFFMLLMYVTGLTVNNRPAKVPAITTGVVETFGKEVEIILTGDVMLGRSVLIRTEKERDWTYPFNKVSEYLRNSDIVFSNLESPIVENCPRTDSGMVFCTDNKMTEGLKRANIGVVTVANNHMGNYGQKGINDTKRYLIGAGIDYTGVGDLVVKEVKGTKFGFLGFDFVNAKPTDLDLKLIRQSDSLVDVLIVGVHWGEEYKDKANKKQREIAKDLVENGADVIAGHHSHWVQDTEKINQTSTKLRWARPVYYSLGNFVFDQEWSEETKKGLVIKLTFKDGELIKEEKLPIYISSLGQPEFR
ncbi:MAG: CapA family protein [bacterium]